MEVEQTHQAINGLVQRLAAEFKPEQIILFGSWAWGQPDRDSDVDLLVVKRSQESPLALMRQANHILLERTIALDLLVYTPEQVARRQLLGDPFMRRVLREGKILYERPS